MTDHLPDIAYANAWLTDIARRLRQEDVIDAAEGEQTLRDMAATLMDIVARGKVIDRYRVELPTVAQANALRSLRRDAPVAAIFTRPSDLPPDYLLVVFDDGFTCGISPDGDVSS